MHVRSTIALLLLGAMLAACATPAAAPTTQPSPENPTTTSPTATVPEPTGSSSTTPSSSPSDGAAQKVEFGYGARLEIGATANVREAPSTSAEVLGEAQEGSSVQITYASVGEASAGPIFGPVAADGYTWYPVALEEPLPVNTTPWLAIEAAAATLAQPDCPDDEPSTLADVAVLAPQERVACFGDDEIELTGMMPLSGLGGMAFGTWEPMWLAYPVNDGHPLHDIDQPRLDMGVRFSPGIEPPELPSGATDPRQEVRLVGHFDDPASATCVVQAPTATEPEPMTDVELYCRTQFVVTEIELVDS